MGFDHFSFLAPHYDRLIPPGDRRRFLQLLNAPPGGWVLDAGGGTGRVAQLVRGQGAHVLVADSSLGMLARAAIKGLRVANLNSEELPFPADRFDRVMMVDALHHVRSQADTIRELWRVLKPGGILVIEEPDVRTFAVKLIALAEKLALMRSRLLTPLQIAALFPEDANVRVEVDRYVAWVIARKDER